MDSRLKKLQMMHLKEPVMLQKSSEFLKIKQQKLLNNEWYDGLASYKNYIIISIKATQNG